MHASHHKQHLSGAERIVAAEKIESVATELVQRAQSKGCPPDRISITIDALGDRMPRALQALDVITLTAPDSDSGRSIALTALQHAGVSFHAARKAITDISRGASPSGQVMRGAMIVDAESGSRLEPDQERGVRASRFDWSDEAKDDIKRKLSAIGLMHFRTREALALATKITHAPGIVAELCWSDDPEYTAGYVASPGMGYVRLSHLKKSGDSNGGRAFFVNAESFTLAEFIEYVHQEPVLIVETGNCRQETTAEIFFAGHPTHLNTR